VSINIYPQNRYQYNIVSFLVGARNRLGHAYKHRNRRNLNFLNNRRVLEDDRLHNVMENIRLLEFLDIHSPNVSGYEVVLPEEVQENALQYLNKHSISTDSILIGFHCGSSTFKNHINKRWSPENFARLGSILADKYNAKVLLFGGPDEKELRQSINEMMNGKAINVVVSSLTDSVALMQHCSVFVANDTSLMHTACGLGIPVVAIFGPTSEVFAYPWKTKSRVARTDIQCRPCFYYSPKPLTCYLPGKTFACIRELPVEHVLKLVEEMLPDSSL